MYDNPEKLLADIKEAFVVITQNPDAFETWCETPCDELEGNTPAGWFNEGKGNTLLKKLNDLIA